MVKTGPMTTGIMGFALKGEPALCLQHRQTDGGGDKHKTSNKECDWEDIDDADLNYFTAFAEENKDQ